jgi:hypothetical protein
MTQMMPMLIAAISGAPVYDRRSGEIGTQPARRLA